MEELGIICKDNNSGFQFKGFQELKDIDQICENFKACRSTAKKSSLQYQLNFVISQLRKQGYDLSSSQSTFFSNPLSTQPFFTCTWQQRFPWVFFFSNAEPQ